MSLYPRETYPHHRLAVRCADKAARGTPALDLRAAFAAPWTVLFGASGSGKSTLLRAMSGFAPAGLRVEFTRRKSTGEWTEFDGPTGSVRPEHRQIAYATQTTLLLPHLSVRDNLLLPLRIRRQATSPAELGEILSLFRLHDLLQRQPRELSGGERQRVSVARALLVPDARLLLLDEPFSGVDRAQRNELLPAIQALAMARTLPVISVTHEVDEPLLLGAEVVRLRDGVIVSQGPAATVLSAERDRLLASLGTAPATNVSPNAPAPA